MSFDTDPNLGLEPCLGSLVAEAHGCLSTINTAPSVADFLAVFISNLPSLITHTVQWKEKVLWLGHVLGELNGPVSHWFPSFRQKEAMGRY